MLVSQELAAGPDRKSHHVRQLNLSASHYLMSFVHKMQITRRPASAIGGWGFLETSVCASEIKSERFVRSRKGSCPSEFKLSVSRSSTIC